MNKIMVDGGAAVNLMLHILLAKIGKFDTDLRLHNMVLSNYKGKTGQAMRVIQVDITVGSITRPTVFMVIVSKANYNLLLGREWIHGIGVVPLSFHQRIAIWCEDGIVENIEVGQGYYMAEVNHVDKRNFDRNLANIAPCAPAEFAYMPLEEAFFSLKLHPTHGFTWDREIMGERFYNSDEIRPTG